MNAVQTIRIGTRASVLARWQAGWVAARLAELGRTCETVLISTQGDRHAGGAIEALGTQGVFTREIQLALVDGRIDLAVHSLKDLPTEPVPGLCLAAVPPRESVRDVLVCRQSGSLGELPPGAAVGTGSARRRAQLWHVRRDLEMHDIRGNVDTRLRKLAEGHYDAIVLAEAGLERLGLASHITQVLPPEVALPAVGQGALGLETRYADSATRDAVARLDHAPSHQAVLAERAMLAALRGGCLAPVAAWGRLESDGQLHLEGAVLSADGRVKLYARVAGDAQSAVELGQQAAGELLNQGAAALIQAAR